MDGTAILAPFVAASIAGAFVTQYRLGKVTAYQKTHDERLIRIEKKLDKLNGGK